MYNLQVEVGSGSKTTIWKWHQNTSLLSLHLSMDLQIPLLRKLCHFQNSGIPSLKKWSVSWRVQNFMHHPSWEALHFAWYQTSSSDNIQLAKHHHWVVIQGTDVACCVVCYGGTPRSWSDENYTLCWNSGSYTDVRAKPVYVCSPDSRVSIVLHASHAGKMVCPGFKHVWWFLRQELWAVIPFTKFGRSSAFCSLCLIHILCFSGLFVAPETWHMSITQCYIGQVRSTWQGFQQTFAFLKGLHCTSFARQTG